MTSCFNIKSATTDSIKKDKKTILAFLPQRWINPRRNLVIYVLIPLLLKKLYVLLGEGLIYNCRILLLKLLPLKIAYRHIFIVSFNNYKREKRIFEKLVFQVKIGYIVRWSCDVRSG